MAVEVSVYAVGLTVCSVCAPASMTIPEVEREVNVRTPTGIDSQWRWDSSEKTFRSGEPNPVQCDKDERRTHYLMSC